MRKLHAWIVFALALSEIAAAEKGRNDPSLPIAFGNASWYGWFWDGRITASGRRFHALADTAASLTLPLGSWARITNEANGKSVVVQITDRGPYVHGRIIDVSLGTARKLGMVVAGVARVKIEPIDAPIP